MLNTKYVLRTILIQLNEYETDPYLSQNMTTDCLLTFEFLAVLICSNPEIVLKVKTKQFLDHNKVKTSPPSH